MNILEEYKISVGEQGTTAFCGQNNNYQDGTTPMYRDTDGKLWAISGHSHMGDINVFCGTCIEDMKKMYPITTNFGVGHAEYAFDHIRYPEGIKARGSIWPFGLYICPNTHRFFCFFHNETGWNGRGTAYDSLGLCNTPHFDSDFRHIGLMHSDDEGKSWTFDRWVITGNNVCFTENYNPNGDCAIGQKSGVVNLGSGDFSLFVEPDGEFMYIVYNMVIVDVPTGVWLSCDTYIARTRKRTDGVMGDFVKYYEGSFCEAGNLGRETKIASNTWHSRIAYFEKHKKYLMCSSPIEPGKVTSALVKDIMEVRESDDMIHWSEPVAVYKNDAPFGNHYMAMLSASDTNQPHIIKGDDFLILTNHNGTDVMKHNARLEKK
ncbi:MAG: hypothetical protein IJO74_04810 [Clostridia bacterium]|nr:hypothetical protein [Clostridia bacterium]